MKKFTQSRDTIRLIAGSSSSQTQGHSESKSYNYQAVPLWRPKEVMRLPRHQSLIMRTGYAALKAEQYVWYKEDQIKHLSNLPVDVPTQRLSILSFESTCTQDE